MKQVFCRIPIFLLFLMSIGPLSISAKNEAPCVTCPTSGSTVIYRPGGQAVIGVVPSGALYYRFSIRPFGNPAPTPTEWAAIPTQVSNIKVFSGLTLGQAYYIDYRVHCVEVASDGPVETRAYTHNVPCAALTISSMTFYWQTSASIVIDDPISIFSFIILPATAAAPSETDWLTVSRYSNYGLTTLIDGLTIGQTYRIYVRRTCSGLGLSEIATYDYAHIPPCEYINVRTPFASIGYTSVNFEISGYDIGANTRPWLNSMAYEISTTEDFSALFQSGTITVASDATTFTVSGLTPNTLYYYRVRTLCSVCNTTCLMESNFFRTKFCPTPLITSIYFQNPTQAAVVFEPVGFTSYVSGYEYAVTTSAAAPAPADWIATATFGTKALTGLVVGTAYYVHVRTVCDSYTDTRVWQAYTHNLPCTTPTSFIANSAGYTTGVISFSAPTWINQVEYQVSTSPTFDLATIVSSATVARTASPVGLTGLMQGTGYYVRARSVCPTTCATACGWTTTSGFVTQLCYETLQLTQRVNSTNRIVFHWFEPFGALVQQYTLTNVATSAVVASGTLAGNVTDLNLTGLSLAAGAKYDFNLRTQCDATNFSAYKTTQFTACDAPTTLPYTVNFNDYLTDELPCSWETQGDGAYEGWRQIKTSFGGPLFGVLTWAQDRSDGDWAYSPNFNFSAGNYELLLDFSTLSFATTSKFQIYLTDSYDPSVFTVSGTKIFEHTKTSTERTNLGIPFTVGSSGAKHLVFHGETGVDAIVLNKLTVRQTPVAADLAVSDYGNDDACNTFYAYNVNSNGWYNIYNTAGSVIASVNPGSVNLGTVTLQMKDAAAVLVGSAAGVPRRILPRHFGFGSSRYLAGEAFGGSVQVKIYFSEAEMAALRTAAGLPALMPSQISLTHFSPPTADCDIVNNLGAGGSPELITATSYEMIGSGNHCLQFGVAHFSEITPHEPSASPLSGAVLPIELLAFKAKLQNDVVEIQWQTAIEQNVHNFTIERSTDGKNFTPLSIQTPKGSNSTYAASDKTPIWGVNGVYYRLKINDLDGTFSYSKVVNVSASQKGFSARIYPNPFDKNLTIDILTDKKTDVQVELIDILGRQVFHKSFLWGDLGGHTEGGTLPLSMPNVPSGAYLLKISAGNQRTIVQRLIKN